MAKAKKSSVALSDVNRELQKVLNKGKVLIGSKETIKAFMRNEAKIIIHASNCPEDIKSVFGDADIEENGELTIYEYPANSLELGLACGKPYPVASLCITDTGDSEILRLLTPNVHLKEKRLNITTR
ncbi:MAG TPA: 50S ribosomal protein L30e [Candidatus Bathyarchaeia archaeon]|nr:50S ribosomal protein L30e [Candidatus Bathyarchaeia archaeon]